MDPRSSHSFISASFATALGLEISKLDPSMFVDTSVGGRVLLDWICRNCDLTISERMFMFDFIILEMSTFV